MKKVNHTIKPSLQKTNPNSNNANTNNRPYCKQITYKEALLHTKLNENNNSTESYYKNNNNNSSCESTKAKTSIKNIIIDDEALPDLAERYNLEKEDDEVDNDKYIIQEQIRVIRTISTKHKTKEEALQHQFEPTLCIPCLYSSKSINLQVIRKLKYIFHYGHTKVITYSFNKTFQTLKHFFPIKVYLNTRSNFYSTYKCHPKEEPRVESLHSKRKKKVKKSVRKCMKQKSAKADNRQQKLNSYGITSKKQCNEHNKTTKNISTSFQK